MTPESTPPKRRRGRPPKLKSNVISLLGYLEEKVRTLPKRAGSSIDEAIEAALKMTPHSKLSEIDAAIEALRKVQRDELELLIWSTNRGLNSEDGPGVYYESPLVALDAATSKVPRLRGAFLHLQACKQRAPAMAPVIDLAAVRAAMAIARRRGAR